MPGDPPDVLEQPAPQTRDSAARLRNWVRRPEQRGHRKCDRSTERRLPDARDPDRFAFVAAPTYNMNIAVIAIWLLTGPPDTRSARPAASETASSSATRRVSGSEISSRPSPSRTPAKTPTVRVTEMFNAENGSPSSATSGTSTAKSGRDEPRNVASHQASVPATTIFETSSGRRGSA